MGYYSRGERGLYSGYGERGGLDSGYGERVELYSGYGERGALLLVRGERGFTLGSGIARRFTQDPGGADRAPGGLTGTRHSSVELPLCEIRAGEFPGAKFGWASFQIWNLDAAGC